jgi:membrane protein
VLKSFLRQLADAFVAHDPLGLAAQLAYFAILSLFPLVMFLLTVIGYLPLHGLDDRLIASFYRVLPADTAQLVDTTLREITAHRRGGLLVSTLAFAVWTASDAALALTTALNRAHHVEETRPFLRLRARALLVTLGCGVCLTLAAIAVFIVPEVVRRLLPALDWIWTFLRWPLALLLLSMTLAASYHFLPNARRKWRLITPGALIAVVGWLLLSMGFKLYVSRFSSYSTTYGALGTVIVLLVWLYWSGVVMIAGGEINAITDRLRGIRAARA